MTFEELKRLIKLLFPECRVIGIPGSITCCKNGFTTLFDIYLDEPKHFVVFIYQDSAKDVVTRLEAAFKVVWVRGLKYYLELKEK